MVGLCYQSVNAAYASRPDIYNAEPSTVRDLRGNFIPDNHLFGAYYDGPSDIVCRNPTVNPKPNLYFFQTV